MTTISYMLQIDGRPAPPNWMEALRLIEVEHRSDAASMFRLRFAVGQDATGKYDPLDDNLFAPLTPVSVAVTLGMTLPQTLIAGYVSNVRVDFQGAPVLEVVGMDVTATLMNLEEKVRSWPAMADSDIATMIFAQYSLVPQVTPTSPVRMPDDTLVFQRGTDIRFLRQLAERNGFQCLVEYAPAIGLAMGYFGPPRTSAPPQAVLSVNMGDLSTASGFTAHYDMLMPAGARAEGLDAATASEQSGEAEAAKVEAMGKESTLDAIKETSLVLLSQSGLVKSDELKTYAQAAADRSTWSITAEGVADPEKLGALLVAAKPVLVRGVGHMFNGAYMVDRVLHMIAPDSYSMHFKLRRNATGLKGNEVFI